MSAASPQSSGSIPVTAIILTQDEAINIEHCLRCLVRVDDVVVVDSGSTDLTVALALAARPGVRIFAHAFRDFGEQRNWAIEHTNPEHDWILFVDADEFCTDSLLDEIAAWLKEPGRYVGGFIAGKNFFLGRWLKQATMYPSYQLRLLKRGAVTFCKHGHGQREVTDGPVHYFKEAWVHEALSKGLKQWIDRHNSYSSEEVELILQLRQEKLVWRQLVARDPILRRRGLKCLAAKLPGRPWLRFLYTYLWRRGFLDGRPGLTYCLLRLAHDVHIIAKLDEQRYVTTRSEMQALYPKGKLSGSTELNLAEEPLASDSVPTGKQTP
jgi:glycosyltransferase involved in cell wall biosynthesis